MKPVYYAPFGIIIFLAFLLSNCKKDHTDAPADIPKIITNAVTVYPDGGVTLNGQINEIPANTTEYGFLLSGDSLLTYPQRLKVAAPVAKGVFKVDIPTGLQKNAKYFVAVYTISSTTGFSHYNTVYFNSSGSKKPVVSSAFPLKADLGDTITIKGKYLSGQYLNITFGDVSSNIISVNDTLLKCLVPISLSLPTATIALKYNGTTEIITTRFSLNTPVITNFTSLVTFRDTLIINGDHFGYQNSLNQVNMGTATAAVVSSTRKQLKVLVPDNVPHSFNNITIKAQAQTVTSATQFQIKKPVITAVTPSSVNVNDPVTIKGMYFHPEISNNKIYSENNLAQLKSGNTTQLTYDTPNGPYPRRKAKITLKLLDYTITYNIDIAVKDRWIVVGQVPFNDYSIPGSFTINNTSYVVSSSLDFSNNQLYLWKFNSADYSWQQISIPFKATNAMVTSNGTKAYMYLLSATNNFYEFDASSNTWTQKADYPAPVRYGGTMFTINNKTYIGLGTSQAVGIDEADNSFYEYNSSTNAWRKIPNYPDKPYYGRRNLASAFVINNIAYVGCGATNTGMYNFFSYSPANNAWTQIQDFPEARSYTTGFSFGNKGFIATGEPLAGTPAHDCFKYDPAADTWVHLNDYVGCNVCGWGIERGYAFINNGYVYVGGGNSSSSSGFLYQAVGSGL